MTPVNGIDRYFAVTTTENLNNDIVHLIEQRWPNLVVEGAKQGDVFIDSSQAKREKLPPDLTEFFVYENAKIKKLWDEGGFTDEGEDKMIHVLIPLSCEHWLTIVYDNETPENKDLETEILKLHQVVERKN